MKKKLSEEEIINHAKDYINYMIDLDKKEPNFKKYNQKAWDDFLELQAFMSLYKHGAEKYKQMAFIWIKSIFA